MSSQAGKEVKDAAGASITLNELLELITPYLTPLKNQPIIVLDEPHDTAQFCVVYYTMLRTPYLHESFLYPISGEQMY